MYSSWSFVYGDYIVMAFSFGCSASDLPRVSVFVGRFADLAREAEDIRFELESYRRYIIFTLYLTLLFLCYWSDGCRLDER